MIILTGRVPIMLIKMKLPIFRNTFLFEFIENKMVFLTSLFMMDFKIYIINIIDKFYFDSNI